MQIAETVLRRCLNVKGPFLSDKMRQPSAARGRTSHFPALNRKGRNQEAQSGSNLQSRKDNSLAWKQFTVKRPKFNCRLRASSTEEMSGQLLQASVQIVCNHRRAQGHHKSTLGQCYEDQCVLYVPYIKRTCVCSWCFRAHRLHSDIRALHDVPKRGGRTWIATQG